MLFPRVSRASTGEPRFDSVELLEEVELDPPLEDALFARPAEGPDDAALSAEQVEVELELNTHHPFLRAEIGGVSLWMLDSGAGWGCCWPGGWRGALQALL